MKSNDDDIPERNIINSFDTAGRVLIPIYIKLRHLAASGFLSVPLHLRVEMNDDKYYDIVYFPLKNRKLKMS